MLYTLLGRIVWRLAKRRLRSRRPSGRPLGAAMLAVGIGAAAFSRARRARAARPR